MQKELKLSVRSLVEHSLRSGDLTYDFFSPSRALDGIRGHQNVQSARPKEYKPEVFITHTINQPEFKIVFSGRVEGVYLYPDRVIIYEIKCNARSLAVMEKESNPLHWGQVKVYAYLYALQNKLKEITVKLTYYQLDKKIIREYQHPCKLEELKEFFNLLLEKYLKWAKILNRWYRERDESIKKLSWPFA